MLKVQDIRCGYGKVPILHGISFQVREGEKLCILGPNGCGKTTLLRALAGLLPYRGSIELLGDSLSCLSPRQRAQRVALMSQSSPAAFDYTVYETVMLGRYARQKGGGIGGSSPEDRRTVRESLVLADAWELRDRLITQLSGGQLQRVFLARLFAQEPQIILLDEPTNHLDLRCQMELTEKLRNWAAAGGRCVVGVLHDINLALSFADTLLLLDEGRLLFCGPAKEFDLQLLDRLYGIRVRAYMQAALERWR